MPHQVPAYAAPSAGAKLGPTRIERRDPGARDVVIEITHCGVCHSDVHQARDEWGGSTFPMVPGHEIVGRVVRVGAEVTRIAVGDTAGVGCLVDSCHECAFCREGFEQFCEKGAAATYNGTEMDRKTRTFGGYSRSVVVDERFVLKVPKTLDPARAAPLLCAGITTYSPLKLWKCSPGQRVGVVGLGGLGHMAVKLAHAMGAEVTLFSTSASKAADAERLGAKHFVATKDKGALESQKGRFDLLIDTVSAEHDYNAHLATLRPRGTMVLVGAPPTAQPIRAFSLIGGAKRLVGSAIGGIPETQEMLEFCAAHGVEADVERISIDAINTAYDRMLKSDVRYRFVIDLATLPAA